MTGHDITQRTAIVLGGGMAGMLAASVLAQHVDSVTVVESDDFPREPGPRRGLPQGNHSHMLMSGGARALDDLLPGVSDALYALGANRRGMPSGMLTLSAAGWFPRHEGEEYVVVCSRALTDHVVRNKVLADGRIAVLSGTSVTGLTGTADRITGVRLKSGTGPQVLPADFVVDATGRRSNAPEWLRELGLSAVDEDVVDSGLAYATQLYGRPAGARDDFPAVLIQPVPGTGEPGRGATLFPIEDNRWIVTLTGTRGAAPPTDGEGFLEFARSMKHPMIAELAAAAEPIGGIRPYRGTVNRRRYFERLPVPDGFVVVGDALASLNPVYAHGMSAAALEGVALREHLAQTGVDPAAARGAQAAVAAVAETPWAMASEQDLAFPDVRTTLRTVHTVSPQEQEFAARLARVALSEPDVANALFGVYTLSTTESPFTQPWVHDLVMREPATPALTAEQAIAQFPEFGDLAPIGVG